MIGLRCLLMYKDIVSNVRLSFKVQRIARVLAAQRPRFMSLSVYEQPVSCSLLPVC